MRVHHAVKTCTCEDIMHLKTQLPPGRDIVSVIILRGVKHTSGFSTNSFIFQTVFLNYLNLTSELLKVQLTQ